MFICWTQKCNEIVTCYFNVLFEITENTHIKVKQNQFNLCILDGTLQDALDTLEWCLV